MQNQTIFLDRDGVVNKEINYLYKIHDFIFIDGIFEACDYFQNLGYTIIIVTNQSGISRGYYQEEDYQKITSWMINCFKKEGVNILDIYHCPHSPTDGCNCRKPKPQMFLNAEKEYGINMSKSWMIGDKETDIMAASSAGISNTILVRSGHKIDEINSNSKFIVDSILNAKEIIT